MSMQLMAQAMAIRVGNSLRKLILIKLADNANDKGECWPSYQHIADQCECSKSAVKEHISALIAAGLVSKENRLGVNNGKGNTSNVYYLCLTNYPVPPKSMPVPPTGTPMPQNAPPMPAGDPPPMPAGATRSSHSFEPVMEPVIEPVKTRSAKKQFTLPPGLNVDAWGLWKQYRKETGLKPYKPTPLGEGAVAKSLIRMSHGDQQVQLDIVQYSIDKQWAGLFEPKNQPRKWSNLEAAQQAADAAIASGRVRYDSDTPFI